MDPAEMLLIKYRPEFDGFHSKFCIATSDPNEAHLFVYLFFLGLSFLRILQIPTQIFPTSYRATCFALVYSSGKIGSIFVQSVPTILYSNNEYFRIVAQYAMAACLVLTSIFVFTWLPNYDLQQSRYRNELNLEIMCDRALDPDTMAPGFKKRIKWFGKSLGAW
jgi:hypothetical protein